MTYSPQRFRELCKEFLNKEQSLMNWKADEYSNNQDRLENFRTVALFQKKRPSAVAMDYLLKHIQSIEVSIRTLNYKWYWQTEEGHEGLKQRVCDARNYLLLLAACIDEEAEGS